jgi:hypothetical protein
MEQQSELCSGRLNAILIIFAILVCAPRTVLAMSARESVHACSYDLINFHISIKAMIHYTKWHKI